MSRRVNTSLQLTAPNWNAQGQELAQPALEESHQGSLSPEQEHVIAF
jgi:hypothetical protein